MKKVRVDVSGSPKEGSEKEIGRVAKILDEIQHVMGAEDDLAGTSLSHLVTVTSGVNLMLFSHKNQLVFFFGNIKKGKKKAFQKIILNSVAERKLFVVKYHSKLGLLFFIQPSVRLLLVILSLLVGYNYLGTEMLFNHILRLY
jgi:hypothetical protein